MKMLDRSNIHCFKAFIFIIDKNYLVGDFYHTFLSP